MSLFPKKRLLIVEDDDNCRESVRRVFRQMDYEIVTAGSIAEALAALEPPPHCLILDLTLPDGPGELILERIRSDNLPTRVVICTGDGDYARLERVRRLKPAAVLFKPLALSEVIAACR